MDVLKVMPLQKQAHAGQRTWFKAFSDYNIHVGLGVKYSKGLDTAIHGAIILSIVAVHKATGETSASLLQDE